MHAPQTYKCDKRKICTCKELSSILNCQGRCTLKFLVSTTMKWQVSLQRRTFILCRTEQYKTLTNDIQETYYSETN